MTARVMILGQTDEQIAHVVAGSNAAHIAEALAKLDPGWRTSLAGGQSLFDTMTLYGDPTKPAGGGLPPAEPDPLPPSTMTRQQRRHLARKGNRK